MRSVLEDVDRVLGSAWYRAWAVAHRTDAGKIVRERKGERRPLSSDPWARTFIEAVRVGLATKPPPDDDPPPPPPPPPPPAYKKVAPRVANKQGASDARYCTRNQPGVVPEPGAPAGHTIDDVGATYDADGLCKNGRRSPDLQVPGLVGALEIDGRDYCSLPTVGDPTKNTGSWAI